MTLTTRIEDIPGTDEYGPCVAIEFLRAELADFVLAPDGYGTLLTAGAQELKKAGYRGLTSSHSRSLENPPRVRIVFGLPR